MSLTVELGSAGAGSLSIPFYGVDRDVDHFVFPPIDALPALDIVPQTDYVDISMLAPVITSAPDAAALILSGDLAVSYAQPEVVIGSDFRHHNAVAYKPEYRHDDQPLSEFVLERPEPSAPHEQATTLDVAELIRTHERGMLPVVYFQADVDLHGRPTGLIAYQPKPLTPVTYEVTPLPRLQNIGRAIAWGAASGVSAFGGFMGAPSADIAHLFLGHVDPLAGAHGSAILGADALYQSVQAGGQVGLSTMAFDLQPSPIALNQGPTPPHFGERIFDPVYRVTRSDGRMLRLTAAQLEEFGIYPQDSVGHKIAIAGFSGTLSGPQPPEDSMASLPRLPEKSWGAVLGDIIGGLNPKGCNSDAATATPETEPTTAPPLPTATRAEPAASPTRPLAVRFDTLVGFVGGPGEPVPQKLPPFLPTETGITVTPWTKMLSSGHEVDVLNAIPDPNFWRGPNGEQLVLLDPPIRGDAVVLGSPDKGTFHAVQLYYPTQVDGHAVYTVFAYEPGTNKPKVLFVDRKTGNTVKSIDLPVISYPADTAVFFSRTNGGYWLGKVIRTNDDGTPIFNPTTLQRVDSFEQAYDVPATPIPPPPTATVTRTPTTVPTVAPTLAPTLRPPPMEVSLIPKDEYTGIKPPALNAHIPTYFGETDMTTLSPTKDNAAEMFKAQNGSIGKKRIRIYDLPQGSDTLQKVLKKEATGERLYIGDAFFFPVQRAYWSTEKGPSGERLFIMEYVLKQNNPDGTPKNVIARFYMSENAATWTSVNSKQNGPAFYEIPGQHAGPDLMRWGEDIVGVYVKDGLDQIIDGLNQDRPDGKVVRVNTYKFTDNTLIIIPR